MTQIGRSEARQMLMVVRKLCGHPATGPSEVFDQSIDRIKRPISPPPARKASGSELGGNLSLRFISALWSDDGGSRRTTEVKGTALLRRPATNVLPFG